MNLLISNDDGIHAEGIQALGDELSSGHNVTLVAPHRERSTTSHSLTLHKPIRVEKLSERNYSVSGNPADCIYVGVHGLNVKPDFVLSGINRGANLGTDVHYSGTVGAAREAALMEIPSIAFSLVDLRQILPNRPKEEMRFDVAARVASKVFDRLSQIPFPKYSLLNVNIPNLPEGEIRGVRVAPQGIRFYKKTADRRTDIRGKDYFWLGGDYEGFEEGRACDCAALDEGFVSVTPVTVDVTHVELKDNLKSARIDEMTL